MAALREDSAGIGDITTASTYAASWLLGFLPIEIVLHNYSTQHTQMAWCDGNIITPSLFPTKHNSVSQGCRGHTGPGRLYGQGEWRACGLGSGR